ncbi:tryptophan synthase subunit alpha [Lottiidibacillus patelloidae]|uniref:Tryptophan synthase alpha chain n=1 Tax=Lottiidibacillus patelloidae TaxID=2670334 RepID=A0A263BWL9_9BACI|nr:tryptophan synthase subunit alpha [Lottiidibacillus patelloidae]OZM58104.1 tryptophan synthase subunit alpha [Lottiidibacillus patelloidae]
MGKQKIERSFKLVEERGQKAFVPYIMAGDGGLDALKERILFLQDCGATVIELGIPFSDPVADGPVIQEAGKRALANGTTLELVLNCLDMMKNEVIVPIILMTYINPIYAYGIKEFVEQCNKVGVDGLIIPDLPFEQRNIITSYTNDLGIALIQLVSITTTIERKRKIIEEAEGFLYAVTVTGITGARSSLHKNLTPFLQELKELSHIPVLAGFGISNKNQAQDVSENCDGVIVGSEVVRLLHENKRADLKELMSSLKNVEC